MRFDLTDEQRLVRDTTRAFLTAEHPLRAVRSALDDADGFDPDAWKRAAGLGWTSPLAPEALGGGSVSDEPLVDLSIVAAEVGRAVAPGPYLETTVVVDSLVRSGNANLRERWLPGLLEGSTLAGWCVDHSAWLRRRPGLVAARSRGGVTLSGALVSVVPAAADVLLVSTPEVTCLLPVHTPGLSQRRMEWLDPSTRHAEVAFDGVAVPAAQVVGDGAGEVERQSRIAWVLQAAELTGVADAVFDLTLDWLADRHSFGRPLASYQALKHRCADMKTWIEASHAIADAAASAVVAGTGDAGLLARAAKAYTATRAVDVVQDCVQMHGGIGVTWEHDLHLYLRRATLLHTSYGTPSDLTDDVAATALAEAAAA